jgi:hypothetical protein
MVVQARQSLPVANTIGTVVVAALAASAAWRFATMTATGRRISSATRPGSRSIPDIAQALRRHDSELRQMCPQRVHQHRALTHQLLTATMQQRRRLLLCRLDRHKSHRRALNSLANRFGIGGIVLIALDVRLHVLRRHQPHLMAQRAELARPVMRRCTRFQTDHTAWNAAQERQHLPAPHSLAQNRRTLCINAVNLKTRSRPIVVISLMDGSLFLVIR